MTLDSTANVPIWRQCRDFDRDIVILLVDYRRKNSKSDNIPIKIPQNVPISNYIGTSLLISYMISYMIFMDVLVFRDVLLVDYRRFFGKSDYPLRYPCFVTDVLQDILYNIPYNIPIQYTIGYPILRTGYHI